jgi:transmembrane sensor
VSNPRKIEQQAARWIARHEAGPLDAESMRAFDAWCEEDARHFGAFVRLEAVSARLDRAGALQGLAPRPPIWRRAWVPLAAAASLLVALTATWLIGSGVIGGGTQMETRTLATQIGEQYRSALSDGSRVELNTATRVAIAYAPTARDVRLEVGEAMFEVAHDPRRPFTVHTPEGDVRAVGTAFSVRVDDGLQVVVAEGRVEILRDGKVVSRVSAGERYVLRDSGDAVRADRTPDQIERALAWREGNVAFAGETLGEAATELNRYNRLKIEVADPRVRSMRFGGYFRATDPQSFVTALESSLPVEAEREGDSIVLRARD